MKNEEKREFKKKYLLGRPNVCMVSGRNRDPAEKVEMKKKDIKSGINF